MAGGAGGFVTRALESILKDSATKKHTSLHAAIQSYLDCIKEAEATQDALPGSLPLPLPLHLGDQNSDDGAHKEVVSDESHGQSSVGGEQSIKLEKINVSIATALSNAGHSLNGAQAELVLNPLRLSFETKNVKVVEQALDCLHKLIAYDHLEGDPGLDGGENAALFADILTMVCSCVDNSSSDSTILQVLKVLLTAVASAKFRVHGEPLLGVIRTCYNIALNSKSPVNQATSKAMLTQMISIISRKMESDPSVSDVSKELHHHSSSGLTGDTEGVSTGDVKSGGETYSMHGQNEGMTGDPDSQNSVDAFFPSIEELQNLAAATDIKGLEAIMDKVVDLEDVKKIKDDVDLECMGIGHRDTLLVFRTLCKMAMEGSDDNATKIRILSLELLQGFLEGVGSASTKDSQFIDSVKAYISYALLQASVSSSPVVFQHAAGIFASLLLRFRENLKGEIGILFPLIVLRYLDNADNQRLSVLRMLEKVCRDPQMLVDIYVNYDCDGRAPKLFERMVKILSKIAQGTQSSDPNSVVASQNDSVKGSSLQCLVNVLKSLVDWEKSHRESQKQSTGGYSIGNELSVKGPVETETRADVSVDFDKANAQEPVMDAAIAEFNSKPSKGIEHLLANKLVENSPASVAEFLKNTSNLDKAMIGDFLGQHEEFQRSVMHAYVDSMNFSGMKFDAAIREFLSGFKLPREAQKIDRIIEKFSERYCADNPSLFENADTAYALAYAVIMLNIDAHNPIVSSIMSKDDFVRMSFVAGVEEMPPKEFLEEIYDSIVKEEIKLKDDLNSVEVSGELKVVAEESAHLVNILNLSFPRRKSVEEISEGEAIIKQTQDAFKRQGVKMGVFYTLHKVELIRPMVKVVGWPLLATFSVIMEEGDNKARVLLCMEGFKAGIHITHILGMDTMRYAFLTSLVRFTFLHAPREMRSKNAEALRTLLELCDGDINSLVDSWNAVLECVSRLEFITSNPSIAATVMTGSNIASRDAVVQSLRDLSGKPTEQVFLNSVKLSSEAIVEFFTALCGVSAEELKQIPARVFSLQKLVEISYYNMARIRLVWARIWLVLSNHFVSAGSHHDEKVAMYAIDSLRQLGMKYLERAEPANFTFQNDILKPFVALMRNSTRESTRRLIVDSVVQMIKSKVANIKSGWRSVFMIFMAAADDESESIVEGAFENVEQVILEHFDQVIGECFLDCVSCLIGFANNKSSPHISLKAIALLRICEDRLAEGLVPGGALSGVYVSKGEGFDVTEHYWFPMLAGLSDLTSDTRAEVRNCALEVLFDLLNERGNKFSSSFWESIFRRVLFPIFDHVRNAGKETPPISSDDEWLHETCIHSLQLLCNLFNSFYKEVSFMLPPLLSLLLDCAKKTDQSVVSIALGALVHLIEVGGHQFSDDDWDTLLKSIRDASYATQPLELLNDLGFQSPKSPKHLGDSNPDGKDIVSDSPRYDSVSRKDDDHADTTSAPPDLNNDGDSIQNSVSEGVSSPSVSSRKPTESADLQRNQSLGQRIMGNRFLRSFTSKSKDQEPDISVQSRPQLPEAVDPDSKDEEDVPLLATVRGKCVTQLLLLSAIDSIQKKYWSKLKAQQKVTIMEILVSMLDFAASYNSYSNLRLRMHQIPADRPPSNLLRQELVGTCVYLDILQKTISTLDTKKDSSQEINDFQQSNGELKLDKVAEEKLVSFCGHVLKDASDFQSASKGTTNMEIHRVLELRSPIIVKVIHGMSSINNQIFRKHIAEFYPLLTKLLCCDQMAIRGALGDLFSSQLSSLLPQM